MSTGIKLVTSKGHSCSTNSIISLTGMQPSLEMAAAQALLGVTPEDDDDDIESSAAFLRRPTEQAEEDDDPSAMDEDEFPVIPHRRPRSDSAGLDALANLASMEQSKKQEPSLRSAQWSRPHVHFMDSSTNAEEEEELFEDSEEEDDGEEEDDDMPAPPPRLRRRRSASNPEGMDKWDPTSARESRLLSGRRDFVLPASILEEELAEVSEAMKKQSAQRQTEKKNSKRAQREAALNEQRDDEVDEASLTPDELLRRARSRLLEDLSYNLNGEKGELTLPHTLEKYQDIYNMNGRIGIYSTAERAAIIARFQRKRSRRVWNKKIRYGCRKSLADRRLRVKGRFVKRSEQEQLARLLAKKQGGEEAAGDEDDDEDKDMLDVDDPDAGFSPTGDSPYRRLRRHTIT